MRSYIYHYILLFTSFIAVGLTIGCTNDELEIKDFKHESRLIFSGYILEDCEPETRSPGDPQILLRENFDLKFYFARMVGTDRACGAYLIPKEYPGLFRSYGDIDSLIWKSPTEDHIFIGWTMPWIIDYNDNDGKYIHYDPYIHEFEDGTRVSFEADDKMYDDVRKYGNDIIKDNTNCDILETFIGVRSNPLNFKTNGDYIANLNFRHLVSKIYIQSIVFSSLDKDGKLTTSNINSGSMTFRNMPSEGVFYRERDGWPAVVANPDAKQEITYEIGANSVFYICPGVDFSNVEFKIKAINSGITDYGEFLGDFKSVKFIRLDNDWWDKEHIEDPKCETTLYAGETMSLKLNLRQGKGTYVSVGIGSWDTYNPREGTSYPYQGIYDSNVLSDTYYVWGGSTSYDEDIEDQIFSIYGDTYYDENGEEIKEIRFYEDCIWKLAIRLGNKYEINGMGHTVTFTQTYSSNKIRIPRIKDIYLKDQDGNTVYIDENYNVYKVDSYGNMTKTGTLEELEEGKNSYLINLSTGEVSQDPTI